MRMSTPVIVCALAAALLATTPALAVVQNARSVVLTNNRADWFYIEELTAISGGIDRASFGAGATQTNSFPPAFGSSAVGAIDDTLSGGCCGTGTHSNTPAGGQTITINFAQQFTFSDLTFHNRQDGCCPERMDDIQFDFYDGKNGTGNLIVSQQVTGGGTPAGTVAGFTFATLDGVGTPNVDVLLQNATATFHQGNFGNKDQTIDGNTTSGGIGFFNNRRSNTVISWETQEDVNGEGLLTFSIPQQQFGNHNIQKFRIAATDADRSFFSDGNPPNGAESPAGDTTAAPGNFTVLQPLSVMSSGGQTMTVGPNGIITASGLNPASDTYTITAANPLGNITGFRLEVLPGPDGNVARSGNGNAVIHEFEVNFTPMALATDRHSVHLNLQNASTSFAQPAPFTIDSAIDGVEHGNNGWGVFGQQNQNQTAVFQTDVPVDADQLVFELNHTSGFNAHKIQNLRLSYTLDPNPMVGGGNQWVEITPDLFSTSLAGSSIALGPNNILEASGAAGVPDTYQILANIGNIEGITGFRLETFVGANGTIGFSGSNGNIVLTEFNVFARSPIPEPASLTLLGLAGAALLRRRRRAAA